MTLLISGGPLDGATLALDGEPPGQLVLGLPLRIGGGGIAAYDLDGFVYEFVGWTDEDAPNGSAAASMQPQVQRPA